MNIIKILTLNNLSRYKLILITVFITAVIISACNNKITDPPPDEEPLPILKDSINIALEDVTHRSITLNLSAIIKNPKTKSLKLFREFNGTKNILTEFYFTTVDTSIIDDNNGEGLILDTVYTYFTISTDSTGAEIDTSKKITGKTLAPTSHNYTWEEITIGEGQSYLTDVWGTDENNVYAVGSVRIYNEVYGVIKWNGIEWLPEKRYGGLNAIFGFSPSDIWAVGGSVYHYNGSEWKELIYQDSVLLSNITYTSLWGTSSSNMYFGTARGKIIHWDGTKARELYSKDGYMVTGLNGYNINLVWAVGFLVSNPFTNLLLKYDGHSWNEINNLPKPIFQPADIITFGNNYNVIVGNGIIEGNENKWEIKNNPTNVYLTGIGGSKSNNIFIGGTDNTIIHFNGKEWYLYNELYRPGSGAITEIFVLDYKIFCVGTDGNGRSKIIIGTK